MMTLTQTSEELLDALRREVSAAIGTDVDVSALHTGGGCMVAQIDLSQDGRGIGHYVWLTREDDREWIVGFYDGGDYDDIGVTLILRAFDERADDPNWVAQQVGEILRRVGARLV